MATIQTKEHGEITFPDTDPINLDGEADAYEGETFTDAHRRLYYVACQCGYMVSREHLTSGSIVHVRTSESMYMLYFDADDDKLAKVVRWSGPSKERETIWTRR